MSKPCRLWPGPVHTNGYGMNRGRLAHRVAYEEEVGPIPEGLVLDHLCRNRLCTEPSHLEPVTQRENVLRGEHLNVQAHRAGTCRRGHPAENLYRRRSGPRAGEVAYCRACREEESRVEAR